MKTDPKPIRLTSRCAVLRSFSSAVAARSREVALPQHNVLVLETLEHVTVLFFRRLKLHPREQRALRRRLAEMAGVGITRSSNVIRSSVDASMSAASGLPDLSRTAW